MTSLSVLLAVYGGAAAGSDDGQSLGPLTAQAACRLACVEPAICGEPPVDAGSGSFWPGWNPVHRAVRNRWQAVETRAMFTR